MLGHCKPCEGGVAPMSEEEARTQLERVANWNLSADGKSISRFWILKNHHQVMALVNAIAYISHRENHHPDITLGYNTCRVCYTTHAIDGLSENDFICAARVNQLEV